jgi:NAD(P)H-hydrate epimerase
MTAHPETRKFIRAAFREAGIPVVIDADGLNAFVDAVDELRGGERPQGKGRDSSEADNDPSHAVVITPHPGEMARLIGKETSFVTANRLEVAAEFAAGHNLYVVLKGFRTVVATPAGDIFVNPTGNPGMATGGTGDILTGLIVGAIAQESLGNLTERLCLAVYLHGAAGDLAAEQLGEETLVATDILQFLGKAWEQLRL